MRRIALIASLLSLALCAGALDLTSYGATVVSRVSEGKRTAVTFRDTEARTFIVSFLEEPSAEAVAQVAKLKDLFYSLQNVKIRSLRFTLTGTLIEALLLPEQLLVEGEDLHDFVPAGLFFSYTSDLILEYDFRVTKDNLFLRVRGTFDGEEEMEQKVANALANPAAFLQRSDPEYFLSRLEQANKDIAGLRGDLDDLTASFQTLSDEYDALAAQIEKLAAQIEDLTAQAKAFAEQDKELAAKDKELATKDKELTAKDKELAAQNKELAAQNKELAAQFETVRYAAMTNENTVWFSRKPIPREGIARVLEIKRENPSLTKAEVAARLKKEGVKMTDQEVRIVFAYYFGEL